VTAQDGEWPGVVWDVAIGIPDLRLTLVAQMVEWMVPPAGIDPADYARDRLRVFLAGLDPVHGRRWLVGLRPGLAVTCRIRHLGAVIAEVAGVVPDHDERDER
jgi:hypothetical protein